MSNDKIAEVGVNIQEKTTVIWNIANALFIWLSLEPLQVKLPLLTLTKSLRFGHRLQYLDVIVV